MDFDAAFEELIGLEGGFQNRPSDRGNWTSGRIGVGVCKGTKYGISAASYPHLDIPNITLETAKKIYRADYWALAGCEAVPDKVKFPLFDFAVNSGPITAAKALQKAVGAEPDGVVGPRTLLALADYHWAFVSLRLLGARMRIMTGDPTFPANGKGWMNRLASLAMKD